MDIDTVQQRAGNLGPVPLDLGIGALAFPLGIGKKAAGAGIHGRHQHEAGRIGQGGDGPGDGHLTVFQGLAQHFQHILLEFRQLIQEKHAVVGQADFARPGDLPAADQSGVGDRVVRGPEGPAGDQGPVARHQAQTL